MIGMSRCLAFAAGLAALAAAGCSQTCGAAACFQGVVVSFTGFAPGTYEVEIGAVTTTSQAAPIATCTLMAGDSAGPLSCSSSESHSEIGNQVTIGDTSLDQIQVTVSANGAPVTQQTLQVNYHSDEINGPGCGVCTSARVNVMPTSSP